MRILVAGLPEKTKNYVAALHDAGMEGIVGLDRGEAGQMDGLLLPGGADIDPSRYGQALCGSRGIEPELDQAQFAVLACFQQMKKPILGICKGHQIINVYFGGSLIQDMADGGRHRADPDDQVHLTHAEPDCWLAGLYGTDFFVNSAHHQAVDRPGEGLSVIQRSEDGVIEAISHRELPILSLQWHPERMCGVHRREDTVDGTAVFRYFGELCERRRYHTVPAQI